MSCQVVEKEALLGPESQGVRELTFSTFCCSAPRPLYLLIRLSHPITQCKSWKWKHKPLVVILPGQQPPVPCHVCYSAFTSSEKTLCVNTFVLLPIWWSGHLEEDGIISSLSAVGLLTIPRAAMLLLLCGGCWTRHWARTQSWEVHEEEESVNTSVPWVHLWWEHSAAAVED